MSLYWLNNETTKRTSHRSALSAPKTCRNFMPRLERLDSRVVLSASASASTISQSVSFPNELIDGSSRIAALPQFDSNIGQLVAVKLTAESTLGGSVIIKNFTGQASLASIAMNGTSMLAMPGLSLPAGPLPPVNLTGISLPAFDGILDFTGPAAVTIGPNVLTSHVSTAGNLSVPADDLAEFVGTGTISVTFSPAGSIALTESNGNTFMMTELQAGASASVEYSYIPYSISGSVYCDCLKPNGVRDPGEQGIAGVMVTLTGQTNDGALITPIATATDATGAYLFSGLHAGTYTVTETQPASYLDGPDTRGNVAPLPDSIGTDSIDSITVGPENQTSSQNNFGEYRPARISGYVYIDANNNGLRDSGESGIGNVTLRLQGNDDLGQSVSLLTLTDGEGLYQFVGLRPGSYTVLETQPSAETNPVPLLHYVDGLDTMGNKTPIPGSRATDRIGPITVAYCDVVTENNFGELLTQAESQVLITARVHGIHAQPTRVVLNFSMPLDPRRAQDVANYRIADPGRDGKIGTRDDRSIPIDSAVYDPVTLTVTLWPRERLVLNRDFRITVKGAGTLLPMGQQLVSTAGGVGVFDAIVQRGTKLSYVDVDGDIVKLNASKGGVIELYRTPTGAATQLFVVQGSTTGPRLIANKSSITGSVVRKGRGNGRTLIPSLIAPVALKRIWKGSRVEVSSVSVLSTLHTAEF